MHPHRSQWFRFNIAFCALAVLAFLPLPFVRQLAACLLIFFAPAWGLTRGEPDAVVRFIRRFVYSAFFSIGVAGLFVLAVRRPPSPVEYVLFLWGAGNLGFLVPAAAPAHPTRPGRRTILCGLAAVSLCAALVLPGMLRVVPLQQDHDEVMEGPLSGLFHRFAPLFCETNSPHYFAKGPGAHFMHGFPLLLCGGMERLAHYRETAETALAARRPLVVMLKRNPLDYQTFLAQRSEVIREIRTTSLFIALLAAGLLFAVLQRFLPPGAALLLTAVELTLPEVFVRSSYAGYTAVSNLLLTMILFLLLEKREWWGAAALLALVNHKPAVLLAAALGAWRLYLALKQRSPRPLLSPTLLGLAGGLSAFVLYGLAVSPAAFLRDQLHRHFLDRLTGPAIGWYPTVPQLWKMFVVNFGPLFCLLALLALATVARRPAGREAFRLLVLFTVVLAVVFSIVDWKQTKHLNYMIPGLFLAIGWFWHERRAAGGRAAHWIGAALALSLLYNGWILWHLGLDFNWLPMVPIW